MTHPSFSATTLTHHVCACRNSKARHWDIASRVSLCITKWINYSPYPPLSLSLSFSLSFSLPPPSLTIFLSLPLSLSLPPLSLYFSLSLPPLSLTLPPSPTDHFALPWPLRLLETDQCIVELQMTSTIDLEAQYDGCHSNYHASMTWCGQDGTQSRLDIRKHIRKQLKQVVHVCVCVNDI